MADKKTGGKPTYAGSISNAGVQVVQAPFRNKETGGKTVVHTGKDLRTGK